MLKLINAACNRIKNGDNFHIYLILYGILLIPVAFFFSGMIAGLAGLAFVIFCSTRYPNRGGLISSAWASFTMILTYFVFPADTIAVHVAAGTVFYFVIGFGIARHMDILNNSNQKMAMRNKALIQEKKRFETLFKSSFDAIVFLDKNHLILDVNQNFVQLFGYKPEEITGRNLDDVLDKGKAGSASRELTQKLVVNGEQILVESTRYNKSGCPIEVVIKAVPIILHGEIIGGYAMYDDITDRKYYEEQLRYMSYHDQLTGLYNRSFFEHSLIELSESNQYPVSIISADLNGLKLINDTMGHLHGDELLKASASILKKSVQNSNKIFRIGGDEFAIILPLTDENVCEKIVNEIRVSIKDYNNYHQRTPVNLSMGASTANDREASLKEVFRRADDFMYREKLYEGTSVRAQLVSALMATLAERDNITEGHALRLDDLCLKIGKKTGLPTHRLANLTLLSQVHDLGKVGIPDTILNKTSPLTDTEWETMRLHPEKGYRIALSSPDLSPVADLILKHHERWDGTGYPLGIKGEEIPLECRILSIVDSFDAMTNDRPYSRAKDKDSAIEEIKKCSGTQFDPTLVDIFLTVIQ